ncbi:MAG: thioredoxin family protein [Planctomycetaceae bacterium]|nr:thioredoxin family protein [Planctomycetaceae bacterium]
MRHNQILWCSAVMAGLLGLISLTAIGANKPDVWKHDFTDAAKEAKQAGRPLLIHFHATWCPPCRQMEKDVLHHADVRDVLTRQFVAVMIDSDQHPELVSQFEIKSLPTDVIIAPDGVVALKSEGGRDRKTYLAQLRHTLEQFAPQPESPSERSQDERLVQESTPGTARVSEQIREPVREDKPVTEVKLLVGLDRYSPVSLAKHRQWRKGKTELALVYQGVVYLLCDAEEYREFQTDPAKYAPRLLGCDPVILLSSDRAIPGSTQFGAYFDGELFLFASPENRDRFKSSPTLYTRPQHVLKVDQVDGPRWR